MLETHLVETVSLDAIRAGRREIRRRRRWELVLLLELPDNIPVPIPQMRTISYWIQRADFTATDHPPVDVDRALDVVRTHDWTGELHLLEEREAGGLETCPPGVGFTASSDRILHICPSENGQAMIHYHFTEPRRWLGLIAHDATVVRTYQAVESSQIGDFVRRFFDDDHAWLVDKTMAG